MKPLYNNYVRQPLGMFIVSLFVVFVASLVFVDIGVTSVDDCYIPDEFSYIEIHPTDYYFINYNFAIVTGDACVYVYQSAISDLDDLCNIIVQNRPLYARYDSGEDPFGDNLWELKDSNGITYVSIEATNAAAEQDAIRYGSISVIGLLSLWSVFAGCTYVLYHAPRYPRLAKLLVRKEFRNF